MLDRQWTTVLALVALVTGASPAVAQTVEEAAVDRFEQCLAQETGEGLDEAARAGLAALADDVVAAFGDCGDDCGELIAESDCVALAELWSAPLGVVVATPVHVDELPEWAPRFAGAIAERVSVCFEAETGEEPAESDVAAIAAYQLELAGALVSVVDSMGCEVDGAAADACVRSVHSMPCTELATGLFAGPDGLATGSGEACATMFDCEFGIDDEALDDLFEQEIGSEEGGR